MSVGPMEIIIVLALALLIFGPKRLPEMGRTLGRAAREFRKASDEVKGVLNLGLNDDQETPGGTAAAVTAAAPPHTPGDGPWSPEDTTGRNGFAPAAGGPGAQALPGLAGFLGVAQSEPEAAATADVPAAPAFASFLGASAAPEDAGADEAGLTAPDAPAEAHDPALTAPEAIAGSDTAPGPEARATAEAG